MLIKSTSTNLSTHQLTVDEVLAIKQREPVRPVILLTAFPPTTVPSAIDLIVMKPFMLVTLREALHKILGA